MTLDSEIYIGTHCILKKC